MINPRVRTMLFLGLPAVVVGVAAALILFVVALTANLLQRFLWAVSRLKRNGVIE